MVRDSTKTIGRSTLGYSFGVVLSRVSGLLRDICLAFFFGTGVQIATFMVAYRFANLLRRVVAESPLASGFAPCFEDRKKIGEKEGYFFTRDLLFTATILVSLLCLVLMAVLLLSNFFLPKEHPFFEIIRLTNWMMPSLVFIFIYGLSSSFLQCERKFFLPALAPVFFNFVWIFFACASTLFPKSQMEVLSIGIVAAFAMQSLIALFPSFTILKDKISVKELFRPKLFHKSLKAMIKPFFLGAIGVSATQINAALDSIFAKYADVSGPAYLWYAIRLEQVPIALFGVSISAALLPALTRALKEDSKERFIQFLKYGMKKSFALMVFSFFALLALGGLALSLVFARGEFSFSSVYHTSKCLIAYSLGLIPHAATLILSAAFYAKGLFKEPVKASIWSVSINILLNALFVFGFHIKAEGIALATSAASLVNAICLLISFRKVFDEKLFNLRPYTKIFCSGAFAFCILLSFFQLVGYSAKDLISNSMCFPAFSSFTRHALFFLSSSLVYMGAFLLAEICFKESHLRQFFLRKKEE